MKYIASFDPQAWIRDYAVSVDPRGDTEWDCTAFVNDPENAGYFGVEFREKAAQNDYIDIDDVLADDPAAPQWVRDWDGPFTITVRTEE